MTRVVAGLALIGLALADRPDGIVFGLEARDLLLGFGVFPAVMITVAIAGGRLTEGPLRLLGPAGLMINAAVIVVLFVASYTAGAAALFYGSSLLVAAWRGLPGCEATVLSNVILGRDDQIGCPTFTPVDLLESRLRRTPPY